MEKKGQMKEAKRLRGNREKEHWKNSPDVLLEEEKKCSPFFKIFFCPYIYTLNSQKQCFLFQDYENTNCYE